MLVSRLSGQRSFLTNSITVLKKDIDGLPTDFDSVYLFGSDKNLTDSFRIEQCADKDGQGYPNPEIIQGVIDILGK